MPSVITSIVSSTAGLLFNKARDISADKLNDGDITDVELREIVVREVKNINLKLDALLRKDLCSSRTFLKEGVDKLTAFLEKQNDRQDVGGEMSSDVESGILNKALQLSHVMEKLKINPDQEFESAIERFKDARITATHAFASDGLRIQDRILAAKFKVVSEILECLHSPATAISGCMPGVLNDLHSLPTVRKIFSVYLNGGVKSMCCKAERVKNVKSVMLINFVLYKFVFDFSSKYFSALDWPTIEIADRSFNPILNWRELSTRKSWGGELMQPPNVLTLDEEVEPYRSAVTGRCETVAVCKYGHDGDIKVISSTGGSKVVNLPEPKLPKEGRVIKESTLGLASDSNNNVYVVKGFRIRTETGGFVYRYVLFVLDENCKAKHDCILPFIESQRFSAIRMAINKNNDQDKHNDHDIKNNDHDIKNNDHDIKNNDHDLIMAIDGDRLVYVCDITSGKSKCKFELDSGRLFKSSPSISDKNEIIIASCDDKVVQIYTDEGESKSTTRLAYALPNGHRIRSLAFHYATHKLVILTWEKESYHLLCYSEGGELETSTCLGEDYSDPYITSHPSGVIAIIEENRITFL